MNIKRIASTALVVGALALGSASAAQAVNYPPADVLPNDKSAPVRVVSPEANRTTVKSTTATVRSDELAYTGSDALIGAAAGSLLILGGAGAVLASRRRATN